MKIFSAPANPDASAQEIARGCLTANLMVPGMGSLAGGKKVGWLQLILCFTGQTISLIFGVRLIYWSLAHWSEFYGPTADPVEAFPHLWLQARWPLLGIVLFAIAWLWALMISYRLLAEAKKKSPPQLISS
jgi:hypothetical protein